LQSDGSDKSADGSAAQTASEASGSGSDSEDSGQDDAGPPREPLQAKKAGGRVRHDGSGGGKRRRSSKHIDLGDNSDDDDDAAAQLGSAAEASASGAFCGDQLAQSQQLELANSVNYMLSAQRGWCSSGVEG